MAHKEFTAPSGLRGIVRGLKLKELKLFGDRRGLKSGKVFEDIIEACWVETLDLGPAYRHLGKVGWPSTALQGDKAATLMAIRRATHGDMFDFSTPCTDRTCRETIKWGVNLADELPMKSYPASAIAKHVAGELFEGMLDGKKVWFELMTSQSEKLMHKFVDSHAKKLETVEATIAFRCKKVEGFERKDQIVEWITEVDLHDVLALRDAMDDVSGGYETAFEIECDSCGARSEVELPLGGKDYWTPKTSPRASSTSDSPDSSSSDTTIPSSGETS